MSGGLWIDYAEVGSKNIDDPEAKLFSILNRLEDYRRRDGKFRFKLCYPELDWGRDGRHCNEWYQTSNPYMDSTITNFEEIFLAFETGIFDTEWGGLGKNPSGFDGDTVMDDTPLHSNWFSAIGAKNYWEGDGFIPGPRHPTDANHARVSKVELFAMKG